MRLAPTFARSGGLARWRGLARRCALWLGATSFAMAPLYSTAQAGVGTAMNQYFSDMGAYGNVTGPTAYQGQSAGYYSLGSAWERFPQKTVYPANVQLPHVRAGCGGIDIFTGSFSFINMSEFVAMLKGVANNALGFAFKLAIDSISPQIGKQIQDLQDLINKVNQFNISSCEASAALVGSVWPKMDQAEDAICQSIGQDAGKFADSVRARRGCGNGGQRSSTIAENKDPALAAQAPGPKNYAWDMISNSPLASSDVQMREFVMTLTGTIVVGQRASDNDPLPITYRGPGDPSQLDALIDGDQPIEIMQCDEETKCLSPTTQTLPALGLAALKPRVLALIQSIDDKIINNQRLTPEETSLLGVASIPLYKIIAVQAASGFRISPAELNTLAEYTSVDMLNAVVQRIMDQVSAGQSNNINQSDIDNLKAFNEQVAQVRNRLFQRQAAVSQSVNQTFAIVNHAMQIESTLQSRMAPGLAASLNFSRALSAQGLRP